MLHTLIFAHSNVCKCVCVCVESEEDRSNVAHIHICTQQSNGDIQGKRLDIEAKDRANE